MKRLIKKANTKTLKDFYNPSDYDFIDIGLETVPVADIIGMSEPRNEDYNDDFSPKDENDSRWIYQMDQIKNGKSLEPVQLTEMPDGKYVINGDGNHRLSAAKCSGLEYLDGYVCKMVSKEENINDSWDEYAKDEIEKYEEMVEEYQGMFTEYNRLMDVYFDNKTKETYKEYKDYEQKMNDFAREMNQFKEELDQKENEYKTNKL